MSCGLMGGRAVKLSPGDCLSVLKAARLKAKNERQHLIQGGGDVLLAEDLTGEGWDGSKAVSLSRLPPLTSRCLTQMPVNPACRGKQLAVIPIFDS